MAKFKEKSLEEKISILLDEDETSQNQDFFRNFKVKLLVSLPLLGLLIFFVINYSFTGIFDLVSIIFLPLLLISLGLFLYYLMIR